MDSRESSRLLSRTLLSDMTSTSTMLSRSSILQTTVTLLSSTSLMPSPLMECSSPETRLSSSRRDTTTMEMEDSLSPSSHPCSSPWISPPPPWLRAEEPTLDHSPELRFSLDSPEIISCSSSDSTSTLRPMLRRSDSASKEDLFSM